MKKISSCMLLLLVLCGMLSAQVPNEVVYHDALEFNLIGKIMDGTANPYHRVDTLKYKGFTKGENEQVRSSSGLAIVFKTNSPAIYLRARYGYRNYGQNTMGIALRGYDLYIKEKGEWRWASSACPALNKENNPFLLLSGMDREEKECLLYLPLYSELYKLEIGVMPGSEIYSAESPFRSRVGIFGSSYTQGISASRPGMTYPAQFTRHTGIQLLSLGCSGNCKMQPYFADALCDADVDAFIFDCFSNPNAQMIEERLFPFIEKIQKAHPGKPLIFQQTIYRERRHFNHEVDKTERAKQEMAQKLMAEAVKKYKDVYFIQPCATSPDHETSVDGIHPSNEGYRLWSESIEKPILKILRKYGIR